MGSFEISLEVNPRLQQFFENDKRSDIRIIGYSNNENSGSMSSFNLHKEYLRLESEYFGREFRDKPSIREIGLDVEDCSILEMILRCFYGFSQNVTTKNIFQVYQLCRTLEIESLQQQIVDILADNIDEFDLTQLLPFQWYSNHEQIQTACLSRLAREKYSAFLSNSSQLHMLSLVIDPDNFVALLSSQGNDFPFLSRIQVFESIKAYWENREVATPDDGENDSRLMKVCEMTYNLIDANGCSSDEYHTIFHQNMFHQYKLKVLKQKRITAYPNQANEGSSPLLPNITFIGPSGQSQRLAHRSAGQLNSQNGFNLGGSSLMGGSQGNFYTSNYFGGSGSISTSFYPNKGFHQSTSSSSGRDDESSFTKLQMTFSLLSASFLNFSSKYENANSSNLTQASDLEQRIKKLLEGQNSRYSQLQKEAKEVEEYLARTKKRNFQSIIESSATTDLNVIDKSDDGDNFEGSFEVEINADIHQRIGEDLSQINKENNLKLNNQEDFLKESSDSLMGVEMQEADTKAISFVNQSLIRSDQVNPFLMNDSMEIGEENPIFHPLEQSTSSPYQKYAYFGRINQSHSHQ